MNKLNELYNLHLLQIFSGQFLQLVPSPNLAPFGFQIIFPDFRSYYKCTNQGGNVNKQIQQDSKDAYSPCQEGA